MAKYFNFFPKTLYAPNDELESFDVLTNLTTRFSFEQKFKDNSAVAIGLMNKNFPVVGERLWNSDKPNITNLPDDLSFYEHCSIFIGQTCNGFVSTTDKSKEIASNKIYKYLNTIDTKDFRYRTDIGFLE